MNVNTKKRAPNNTLKQRVSIPINYSTLLNSLIGCNYRRQSNCPSLLTCPPPVYALGFVPMKHRQHLQPSAPITYPTRYQELCNETQSNSFDKEDSDTMQRLRKLKQHRNQPMALHATEFDNLVKELNSAKSTKELIGSLIRSLKYLLFAQVSTYDHNNPDKELSIGEAIKLEQNVYDHPSLSDSLMNNQYQQSAPQQNSQSVPEEDVDMGHVKRGNRHHNNNTNGNKNNRQINTGTPTYAFSALYITPHIMPPSTTFLSFWSMAVKRDSL
ncbi:unnamed protein product [Absidia cylindrospora]